MNQIILDFDAPITRGQLDYIRLVINTEHEDWRLPHLRKAYCLGQRGDDKLIEALEECRYCEERYGHMGEKNRRHLARELADVVYVAYRTAHAFDIDLDAALEKIYRAAREESLMPQE